MFVAAVTAVGTAAGLVPVLLALQYWMADVRIVVVSVVNAAVFVVGMLVIASSLPPAPLSFTSRHQEASDGRTVHTIVQP